MIYISYYIYIYTVIHYNNYYKVTSVLCNIVDSYY